MTTDHPSTRTRLPARAYLRAVLDLASDMVIMAMVACLVYWLLALELAA